ncbi:MAG TPA: universal stress protein [Tepidisphaeraceae bacterium]|jgi:nucleotide-binding universal stress UspA family protein|nr:universal stress protein [Tepidisphaeraceae bacterium]
MKRIMALIDFSDVTPAVVSIARNMSRALMSELVLVHVVESETPLGDGEIQEDLSPESNARRSRRREMEIVKLALKKEGIDAKTRIVEADSLRDNVVRRIFAEVAEFSPDLIVIGSHGHGRLYHFLVGGVADTVVRKAACPVLIVPSRKAEKRAP